MKKKSNKKGNIDNVMGDTLMDKIGVIVNDLVDNINVASIEETATKQNIVKIALEYLNAKKKIDDDDKDGAFFREQEE